MSKDEGVIARFVAFPPTTGNMISVDGHGAAKVSFSVPEDQLPEAIKATLCIDKAFEVILRELG